MRIFTQRWFLSVLAIFITSLTGIQAKHSAGSIFAVNLVNETSTPQTVVAVKGRQIMLNGLPFLIRGVGYSPVPIGIDPETTPPYGDYFTVEYNPVYAHDVELLRHMGANTLRLWGWNNSADHNQFLDLAYNGGSRPLYVIVTFWMGHSVYPDISSPGARTQIKAAWRSMVASHKNNPAILMWAIGNELNAPWMYGGQMDDLFSLADEMAQEAHAEEGAIFHPVTMPLADINLIQTIAAYESSVPNLDVWSVQVFRGNTFGNLFAEYEAVSTKPLVITELGIDAYDDQNGDEYENQGLPYQAIYAVNLWKDIEANATVCAGGSIMAFRDEWWKGKYGLNDEHHPNCPDLDPDLQRSCGYPILSHPDGYANEEYWGIFRAFDNGTMPDRLEPRSIYRELQALWVKTIYLPFVVR